VKAIQKKQYTSRIKADLLKVSYKYIILSIMGFIETARKIEGSGPLDLSLFAGFILYGALAGGGALWIVGAGLGFMRFLAHKALNPGESHMRTQRTRAAARH